MWFTNPYRYLILLVVATLLATASNLFAQQYRIIPNDSIITNAPFNDVTHFNISQTNLSGSKLVFSWKQIYTSIPTGWAANLCDNGHCYTDFPLSGTMDTVYSGDYGLMSVSIDPGQIIGTAVIRYELWETASPDVKDTLTWIITASSSTGIEETTLSKAFFIYPTPAKEVVNIHALTDIKFIITDLSGKQIRTGMLKAGISTLPVNDIPEGNYLISISSNQGAYRTQKMIIQH